MEQKPFFFSFSKSEKVVYFTVLPERVGMKKNLPIEKSPKLFTNLTGHNSRKEHITSLCVIVVMLKYDLQFAIELPRFLAFASNLDICQVV